MSQIASRHVERAARAARLAARWSQETLAEGAGISRNYVIPLELDRESPTVDVLLAIFGALEVSAAEIIGAVEQTGRSCCRKG